MAQQLTTTRKSYVLQVPFPDDMLKLGSGEPVYESAVSAAAGLTRQEVSLSIGLFGHLCREN